MYDFKKIEEQLNLQGTIISETENWWSITITKEVAKYQGLIKKLQENFDDSLLPEIERLEKSIAALQNKANFEKRNIAIFQKKCDDFNKLKANQEKLEQKVLMTNLSAKLAKKLNRR